MSEKSDTDYTMETHTENIAGVDFKFMEVKPLMQEKETDAAKSAQDATIASDAKTPSTPQEPAEIMPDPTIGVTDMNKYGYQQDGILPLHKERALELFDKDNIVYLLHPDNTESMALPFGD